jgi:hypothetical protein
MKEPFESQVRILKIPIFIAANPKQNCQTNRGPMDAEIPPYEDDVRKAYINQLQNEQRANDLQQDGQGPYYEMHDIHRARKSGETT